MKKYPLFFICLFCFSSTLFAQSQSAGMLIQKGNSLHDQGDYDNALVSYNAAIAIDKNSDHAYYEIANTYMAMKRYQETINYADKVIGMNSDLSDQAFILKGTALDLMGKYNEALQVYHKGLKLYPGNYLLQYNIALTYYNQKMDRQAENHAIKAIEINARHKSSHVLLSQCKLNQDMRAQATMCMFYFLMLENDSKRAESIYSKLQSAMESGVSKESEDTIKIAISEGNDNDEFKSIDVLLSLTQASKYDIKNKGKNPGQLFYEQSKFFFDVLIELKEKNTNKGIGWDTYVSFFQALKKSGNTEAFCYYISATAKDGRATSWLTANKNKVNKLVEWCKHYN